MQNGFFFSKVFFCFYVTKGGEKEKVNHDDVASF